jgi:hypothetical protein
VLSDSDIQLLSERIFSNFAVKSPSSMTYKVEIRDLNERAFSCNCPDLRTAGLAPASTSTILISNHFHKGRQNASMCPWRKRLRRLRTVSVPGKCSMPKSAWSALSARSQSVWAKPRPGHHGDEERHQNLGRRDRVVSRAGEGHQLADLSLQPDALEERDQADQSAERRDRLGHGTDLDFLPDKNRTAKTLHRLVMGHGWW